MLDHFISGLHDSVLIRHKGDLACLSVWRDRADHGAPFQWSVATLRGQEFIAGSEVEHDHDGQSMIVRIRHAGALMLARIWYCHEGRNRMRFIVSLNASLDWRFEWEHLTKNVPPKPEPKGTDDAARVRQARPAPGLPDWGPDDRPIRLGPISRSARRRAVGDGY